MLRIGVNLFDTHISCVDFRFGFGAHTNPRLLEKLEIMGFSVGKGGANNLLLLLVYHNLRL